MTCPEVKKQLVELVRPPERLKVSEWAHNFVRIPEEGNAEPGRYSLARMPHQEEMLDDAIDPDVREFFWMMASQAAGKTTCLNIITAYTAKVRRKALLVVRATLDTAREWVRDKLMPLVEAMPCMRGVLKDPREKGSGSTALKRKFPGGSLKVAGAKSPATMRGSSQGNVYQDEIDSYEITKEGDPCALADRAAITFSDSSLGKMSTPTIVGFSRIDAGFQRGDRKYYFLPCCCCGEFQWLKDEQLKFSFTAEEYARHDLPGFSPNDYRWESGKFAVQDTSRAIYVCEHCGHGWTDAQRLAAYFSGWRENPPITVKERKPTERVFKTKEEEWECLGRPDERGKGVSIYSASFEEEKTDKCYELRAHWRATAVFNGVRSRHLSGMYLTMGKKKGMVNYLQQFAEDFLKAVAGGRETLMVWWNIFKCRAYEDPHQKVDWKVLKERAEDYLASQELPAQVVWICFGADVQADRVEILFWGWGSGQEAWALEWHVIYGDFDMPSTQQRVEEYLLNKRFKHPVLGELPVSAGAIDSGHQTRVKAVFQFTAKHILNNWWSVKGFDNALGAVYQLAKEKVYGGKRFNLNVDYIKTLIFDRLKNTEPGPRYIHFPKEDVEIKVRDAEDRTSASHSVVNTEKVKTRFSELFYAQLCSEKRITVKKVLKGKGGAVGFEMKWVKLVSSARNEVLDMTVYAFGVFEVCREEDKIERLWKQVREKLKEMMLPAAGAGQAAKAKEVYLNLPTEKKIPEEPKAGVLKSKPEGQKRRKIRINSPFRKMY